MYSKQDGFDLYFLRQIPENTDIVISSLILTKGLFSDLEFIIELYLMRQIPKNTDKVVSGLILTKGLLSHLEFVIGLNLVRQIPKNTDTVYGYGRLYLDWY